MNTSALVSATRFRKDNDGEGIHNPIVKDKKRGAGLKIGGNLNQVFQWEERVPTYWLRFFK